MLAALGPAPDSLLASLVPDPQGILDAFGPYALVGLFLVVFAESGLLVGFFLPGDSLLFTAGVLASKGHLHVGAVLVGCFVAAVVGDQVGYNIGRRLGPALFRRPDSRVFKQEHVARTKVFFEHHGPKTILFARFVPIVRTFAPVLAGVGEMPYRTFTAYNVGGGFLWSFGVTLAGFALGSVIGDDIDRYLLPIIGLIVLASLVPPLLEWLRHRRPATAAADGLAPSTGADEPGRIAGDDQP